MLREFFQRVEVQVGLELAGYYALFVKNVISLDPVKLLEFQWGLGKDLQEVHQQKRRALLQRSSRRVEEIKVKVNAKESKPAPSKAKTKSETHRPINAKSKGGPAEPHRTTKIQQKRSPLPPPGIPHFTSLQPFLRSIDIDIFITSKKVTRFYEGDLMYILKSAETF